MVFNPQRLSRWFTDWWANQISLKFGDVIYPGAPWFPMRAHKLKLGRVALIATILVAVAPFRPVYAYETPYEKRVALLIGMQDYTSGLGRGIFRDLPYTVNDLEAVGTVLKEIGFDTIYVFSDVKEPIDSKFEYRSILPLGAGSSAASAAGLWQIIFDFLSSLKKDQKTLLFMYFTGHGGTFEGEDRVLALPDSNLNNPESFSRVQKILEVIAKKKLDQMDTMLVIDACADDLEIGPPGPVTMSSERLPVHLFSSGLGEISFFDRRLQMSVFSHHFVKAFKHADSLGTGNKDDIVTSDEIKRYVKTYVPKHGRKEWKKNPNREASDQNPWGSGNKNIELGPSLTDAQVMKRKPGESEEHWEARLTGLLKSLYGK